MSALLDGRGCLTEAAFVALDAAPPGTGPVDAAVHLAGCARCQRRFLARGGKDVAGISAAPGKAVAPPVWRAALVLFLLVALLVAMAIALRWVAAR